MEGLKKTNHFTMKDFELLFDKNLNQYYYKFKNGLVSFDSPSEIKHNKPFIKKLFKRQHLNRSNSCQSQLSNSSQSSRGSQSSQNSDSSEISNFSLTNKVRSIKPHQYINDKKEDFDDEYLLNFNNFKNFAGTSLALDSEDDDSHSIVSFYHEDNESEDLYTFDKEKERIELRLQFLKELE